MFKAFLYKLVNLVYRVHQKILSINDRGEITLTDKQLHFIVVGLFGLALLVVIFPIFKWLAKKNLIMSITWIYVFSILVAITLLIEIGQGITGTGDLDFKDIVAGLLGFIAASLGFIIIRQIYVWIKNRINK